MAILDSLRFRVLVGSILLLVLLFGLFSFITVRYYTDRMTQQVMLSADRMSDVIRQSTRYGMLLNRREDVHQIISMIATEPGVDGIRIYNKRGEIMFSTDKREEGAAVDLQAEACTGCHGRETPISSLSAGNRTRIYTSTYGHRVVGVINPIRNSPSCSDASCHAHPPERTILGVLDVRVSLQQMDATIAEAKMTMTLFAAGMILLAALISRWYFTTTVIKPVKILMNGAREVSGGNLDHRIRVKSKDELGKLADAFNTMTASLRDEQEQNRVWAATLEEKIAEKTEELTEIHKRILHVEKMASLGKLAATVAHELNNPLEAILTYAKVIGRRLRKDPLPSPDRTSTIEDVDLIAGESRRCGTIVKNLLLFSKKQVSEFGLVKVDQIVARAGEIVRHHCQISSVKLEIGGTGDDATIMCDEGQIQQALVALFVNAVEAMPGGGTITVTTTAGPDEEELTLSVADTGVGIPPEDLPQLFEPFFTTKKDGRGVGLGLSVVYGIVERHGGRISVVSEPGKGTRFDLILPKVPRGRSDKAESENERTMNR
jgi:two-component system NtrC family sensor kinase